MNLLDIILAGFLVYGIARGAWNGFFVELASLLSLLIGVFVAIKFSFIMRGIIENHVSWTPRKIEIASFIITFVLVVVAITVLAKTLTTLANFASLGIFNKGAGGFLGLLKSVLILSIALNVFQKLNVNNTFVEKQTLNNSLFYYPILEIAGAIYPAIENWFLEIKESENKN